MRKSSSSLLLLAMLVTAIAPLLALPAQALPACCRAGGKHHCATAMNLGGEGFQAQAPACPYHVHAAVTPAQSALQGASPGLTIAQSYVNLTLPAPSMVGSAPRYSLPQRGPPLS